MEDENKKTTTRIENIYIQELFVPIETNIPFIFNKRKYEVLNPVEPIFNPTRSREDMLRFITLM